MRGSVGYLEIVMEAFARVVGPAKIRRFSPCDRIQIYECPRRNHCTLEKGQEDLTIPHEYKPTMGRSAFRSLLIPRPRHGVCSLRLISFPDPWFEVHYVSLKVLPLHNLMTRSHPPPVCIRASSIYTFEASKLTITFTPTNSQRSI